MHKIKHNVFHIFLLNMNTDGFILDWFYNFYLIGLAYPNEPRIICRYLLLLLKLKMPSDKLVETFRLFNCVQVLLNTLTM